MHEKRSIYNSSPRKLKQCRTVLYLLQPQRMPHTMTPFLLKKIFLILVDLQCSVNFCCTAKWPSHTYIYIHILFLTLSSIIFHHKWLDIVPCAVQQDFKMQWYTIAKKKTKVVQNEGMKINKTELYKCQLLCWEILWNLEMLTYKITYSPIKTWLGSPLCEAFLNPQKGNQYFLEPLCASSFSNSAKRWVSLSVFEEIKKPKLGLLKPLAPEHTVSV